MANQKVLDEVVTKVNELLAQSPVKDVEKNLRVMLGGLFTAWIWSRAKNSRCSRKCCSARVRN